MITNTPQSREYDAQRRKKALMYTAGICGAILLMFFLISWRIMPPPPPPIEQMIEVNLGNLEEGFGEIQPLVKGKGGPVEDLPDEPASSSPDETDNVTPEDNAEEDAAVVKKTIKAVPTLKPKSTTDIPPVPKPRTPKIKMPGQTANNTGNNDDEDNWVKSQGKKPNSIGDDGSPGGDKDSYGNTPGGIKGGPRVRGNRKIIRHYAFTGDLKKATIYALVRVSPAGTGTFISFDKGSTSRGPEYAQAISTYLRNIQFDKSNQESTVQVQFNFSEN